MSGAQAVLAADVGGTFTDIILTTPDGVLHRRKVPSTPPEFGRAVTGALPELLRAAELDAARLDVVLHATTAATNAVLELRGARTALVTTRGFRDVLELGRGRRPNLFDLTWTKPPTLVPRALRFEVEERMDPTGEVLVPLDRAAAETIIDELREAEVEAVAICLINSYANPAHERELLELLSDGLPGVAISASCEVLPAIKEYERTSTACVNAYLQPLVDNYVGRLEGDLVDLGVDAPLRIMQSNGGLTASGMARRRPVYAIESGPGAGVMAAIELGSRHGVDDLIAFDMGGTTAKATLIESGRAHEASEYEVGGQMTASRLLRGGGYAIGAPAIDIAEVGAGGGSIFSIDAGGAPRVGPQSAGALPGPACYSRGGELATVTDANVVLGYLNPSEIGGGSQKIDPERAARAIDEHVAGPLGTSRLEAAWGVHTLANATMARAVRSVSMERGRDPRDFSLMAFGGSGPIHAVGLARTFQISKVIVPPSPGLLSAIGLVTADATHDEVMGNSRGAEIDIARLREGFAVLEERATAALEPPRPDEARTVERSLDLRYRGQSFELTIQLEDGPIDERSTANLRQAFDAEYEQAYGHNLPGEPVEIVTLRFRDRRADRERVEALHRALEGIGGAGGGGGTRMAKFADGEYETPVVVRADLDEAGTQGPLLIEEMDATIVIPPDCVAIPGKDGSVLIEVPVDE
ncbi:MAG: hydantoinase/oxoprolinase family protein [Actinobacteria bacterium]|nr:hydantoinase/oxoprolinase family protein [Actinomycetota bacterium]